jgi:hypothetical protein
MSPPVLLYADPFGGGHHAEYLDFFIRVCDELNTTLHAIVPDSVWHSAVILAEGAASSAEFVKVENLHYISYGRSFRFLKDVNAAACERLWTLMFSRDQRRTASLFFSLASSRNLVLIRANSPGGIKP